MDPINRPGIGSVGVIGASPNTSGASITGNVLTLQPASASFGGVLTSGTQTIAGAKTFTGAQVISNQLAVGTAASTFSQLAIGSTGGISGTVQLALYAPFAGNSAATVAIRGAQFSVSTPAAAMTCAEVTGFTCANNSAGAGSTITRSQGVVISPQNAGTNNCAILHDFSAAYTGNWFIRDEGTYPSRFGGAVTISDSTDATSTTAAALVVTGGHAVAKRSFLGTIGATFAGNVLAGVQTGAAAVAGQVGEEIKSTVTGVASGATTTAANATSISLTAGDWLLSGYVVVSGGATGLTSGTAAKMSIVSVSATNGVSGDTMVQESVLALLANGLFTMALPAKRVSISTTTTHYLTTEIAYVAGSPTIAGTLTATRVR